MSDYLSKHKWHLFVLVILIIIVGISWYVGFVQKNTRQISNFQISPATTGSRISIGTISNKISSDKSQTPKEYQIPNIQYPISDTTTTEQLNNKTIEQNVTSYKLQVTSTSTALEAMQNSQLDFKTKTFSGLGEFVEEIGGLKNDPQGGKYWGYFINGESAKLGISTQIVAPGDLIEWNYGTTNL